MNIFLNQTCFVLLKVLEGKIKSNVVALVLGTAGGIIC